MQDIEYRSPSALQVIVMFPEQPPSVARGVILSYTVSIVLYGDETAIPQRETLNSPDGAVNGYYRVDFDGTGMDIWDRYGTIWGRYGTIHMVQVWDYTYMVWGCPYCYISSTVLLKVT